MRRKLSGWLFCLALLGGLVTAHATTHLERMVLDLGGERFELEYAADPDDRRQGLMGRKRLPGGTGMLFDFPTGTQPAIWMRNMVISLDLVYIDDSGVIAGIFPEVPPCPAMPCEIYHAQKALRFVLEVPAGTAQRLGLAVGQKLDLGALTDRPPPRR